MDIKSNKEDEYVFNEICDCIDSIAKLNKAASVIENNITVDRDSIDLNLDDIKEEIVDDDNIINLLLLCENWTQQIETSLDLQKELNEEVRRKIQEAISWL